MGSIESPSLSLQAGKEDCFYEKAPILFLERVHAFGGKGVCFFSLF